MSAMTLLFYLTMLAYLLATVLYLGAMFSRRSQTGWICRWVLLAGVLLHAGSFAVRHSSAGGTPVTSLHESLSFFAWCLILLFLLLDYVFDFR